MAANNNIKNVKGVLASAFGVHLVNGYTFLYEVLTGTGEEKEVVVVQGLGDGHGAGWDGPREVTYRAHAIDPSRYHFHPGTFSKGEDDPVQGVDSWFPSGITYNGTAYMVAKLPPGIASEDNPNELQGIYRCLRLPNYNSLGQQIDINGVVVPNGATPEEYFYYSANPARVAAYLILFGRGLSKARIDWAAWTAWRDYCDTLIPWEDGTTTEIPVSFNWTTGGGMTPAAGGAAYKSRQTTGAHAWDSGTTTQNACPVNANRRGIEFTVGTGAFMAGLSTTTEISGSGFTYGALDIALYFETGTGALKCYARGAYLGTLGTWALGDVFRIQDDAGAWKFYKNGVLIPHGLALAAPPTGALYGAIACNAPGSGVTSAGYFPAAGVGSTTRQRMIPRFECHIAFTQETSLEDALDQVCFMACADWQETPEIRFLTPEPAVMPGLEAHAAQRLIVHHFDAREGGADNILKRTITAYPVDVRERWSKVTGAFRDLDHQDLIEDFVDDDRDALIDQAKRIVTPGQINLGNMNRSQALRVLKWLMRLRSDRIWFCELRAGADSLDVLPGDVVKVSHPKYNWVEKLFMVIDAADDGEGADERTFILQEYDPANYYHDDDHQRGRRTSAPPTPNPFAPAPVIYACDVHERLIEQQDGTVISAIHGTVTFTGFSRRQLAKVYIKPAAASDSEWELAGANPLHPHPETGMDVFEVRGVAVGNYHIKVVTESETTAQLPFSQHPVFPVTVAGKLTPPPVPTGLSATLGDNGMVRFTCTLPPVSDFAFLRVYDSTGAVVISRVDSNTWQEPPPAVGSTITRKVTAFNYSGRESGFSNPYTFTMPLPLAPTDVQVTRLKSRPSLAVTWTALEGFDYQVSRDQVTLLYSGKSSLFIHENAFTGAGTYTYYVRSVRFGQASAWVAAEVVIAPPAAPANVALTRQGRHLSLSWAVEDGQEYQVSADQATILWSGRGGSFRHENAIIGAAIYMRYVRTLKDGLASDWTLATLTVNPPPAPTGFTLQQFGATFLWKFTALSGMEYEFSPDQSLIIGRGTTGEFIETGIPSAAGTYTRYLRAVEDGVVPSAWTPAQIVVVPPQPPAVAAPDYDGLNLIYKLTASTSPHVTRYLVKDTLGNLIADDIGLEWKMKITSGTSAYTLRFYAATETGLVSTSYTEVSFTVPVPNPVLSYTLSHELDSIVHTVTPPAVLPDGLEFEFARANDGTGIIGTRKDLTLREYGYPVASRSLPRYVRTRNLAGRTSGWTAAAPALTVAVPAAPTLTKDAANGNPTFLPVQVATTTTPRARIRHTIVQVRATGPAWPSTAEGTPGTYRITGAPPTIDINWTAGGTMEFRVAHEDEFSEALNDRQWSATTSHTFPQFNDGAIDPASNFLKKASTRNPIITGGGTFKWSSDYKFSWTDPLLITGLPSIVSTNHNIEIAANPLGTSLGEGQRLVAVHTLGQTTAALSVVTLSNYEAPAEREPTQHYPLAERKAGETRVKVYTGHLLSANRFLDASVLIPRLASFEADFQNLIVGEANIGLLHATKIIADSLYGRIVFGDRIGSQNFISYGDLNPHAEEGLWHDATWNITISSDRKSIIKTSVPSGFPAGFDAKAVLTRAIHRGAGYVEWPAGMPGYTLGFNFNTSATAYNELDYAFYYDGINTYANESGTLINLQAGALPAATLFRLAVNASGQVEYWIGGVLKRTVTTPTLLYPLKIQADIYNQFVVINNMKLHGVLTDTTGKKVRWQNRINCSYDANDDLSKTGGAANTHDAGAVSVETFRSGQDVWIEHQVADLGVNRTLGFTELMNPVGGSGFKYEVTVDAGNSMYIIYNYGAAYHLTDIGAVAVGDVIRVAVENGVFTVRRNGVLRHFGTGITVPATFRAGVGFYTSGATLKTIRWGQATAKATGWQAGHNGDIEMAGTLLVDGNEIGDVGARALQGIRSDKRVRGNDGDVFLMHKVTALTVVDSKVQEDGDVWVQWASTFPGYGTDNYANGDSIRRAQVRVLNKFGEHIKTFPLFPCVGDGVIGQGIHSRKYADPLEEAIYEVIFYNVYGPSAPKYLNKGVTSDVMPALVVPNDHPRDLTGTVLSQSEVKLSFRAPTTNTGGGRVLCYRRAGTVAWTEEGLITANPRVVERLDADTWWEFRIASTGTTPNSYSNILRLKTLQPQLPAWTGADGAPAELAAAVASSSQINLTWANTTTPQPINTINIVRYNPDGTKTNFTAAASTSTSYSDTTCNPDTQYTYALFYGFDVPNYVGPHWSNPTSARTPASATSSPTGLSAARVGTSQINLMWVNNGGTGTIYIDWKEDDGNDTVWPNVAITPGAVSSYQHTGRAAGKAYAYRIRNSQTGTVPSNVARARTEAMNEYGDDFPSS